MKTPSAVLKEVVTPKRERPIKTKYGWQCPVCYTLLQMKAIAPDTIYRCVNDTCVEYNHDVRI